MGSCSDSTSSVDMPVPISTRREPQTVHNTPHPSSKDSPVSVLRWYPRRTTRTPQMKARPLPKNKPMKRSLALKSTAGPSKQQRTQQNSDAATAQHRRARGENATGRDVRQSSSTAPAASSGVRTQERSPQSDPQNSSEEGSPPVVISSARPHVAADSLSTPSTQPSVSRDMLVDLLKSSEQRVIRHNVSQQRVILERIEAVECFIRNIPGELSALNSSVKDIKLMMLPGTSKNTKSSSMRTSKSPRYRSKTGSLEKDVIMENPTLAAELDIIFATDISSAAAARTIVSQMQVFHRNKDTVSISSRAMNVFLYSCQRGKGKSLLKDGIGFRHGEFRFKIAKTMLDLAGRLPDQLFSTDLCSRSSGDHEGNVYEKPSWLTTDLVDVKALKLARMHHEWFVSDLPKDPEAPEKKKALYIAKRFFKIVVDMLRRSRDKSKVRMFEDGTYCLLNWEGLGWLPSELSNPTLSFLWLEEDVVSPSEIPETCTGQLQEVGEANKELLQNLISERREMLVEVKFDVIVSKETTVNARRGDPKKGIRTTRRLVNSLRIATAFISAFCHVTEEDLLRSSTAMLQCLYRFALVIRNIFVEKISEPVRNKTPSRAAGTIVQHTSEDTGSNRGSRNRGMRRRSDAPGDVTSRCDEGNMRGERELSVTGREISQEQQPSNRRNDNNNKNTDNDRDGKIIPLLDVRTLFPSDSDRDRILENYTNMTYDTYDRLHVVMEGDEWYGDGAAREDGPSDIEDRIGESDSGDDDMSDMIDDNDE